jgi:folate-binding protein YgfZ
MSLRECQLALGATLAPDGIPLDFGDQRAEYQAALNDAVLMDRSHEGRFVAAGRDRINLIQRISTNELSNMALNEGRATIFTNANGRILDRIMVYNRGENALVTTEPGRGSSVIQFLQRQVFFNDETEFTDLAATTRQFVLHGPQADRIIASIHPSVQDDVPLYGFNAEFRGTETYIMRKKSISGGHWAIIAPVEDAEQVWDSLLEAGAEYGLIAAGSLIYNALRIRAGRPGIGHELTTDYIPLEAGLWDEVSFSKGCYTGQEIIARMESRNRLAKTIVTVKLSQQTDVPVPLLHEGKQAGILTSSVTTPDNEILGIGFVKVPLAHPGETLTVGEGSKHAEIISLAGVQSPDIVEG